jgi:hypothetical protein
MPPSDGRRGWGLNLIRGLMDDVQLESVDDGTPHCDDEIPSPINIPEENFSSTTFSIIDAVLQYGLHYWLDDPSNQ